MRAGPVTVQGLSSPELLNYLRKVDRRPQGGCAGLTSPPAVASRAEVSPATVYRRFPGLDDLILGVLRVMRPRIGQTHKRLAGVAPDGLADLTRENFDSYEEHADVLVPLMESRAFNRVRVGSEGRRAPLGADVLRPLAPSAIWRAWRARCSC